MGEYLGIWDRAYGRFVRDLVKAAEYWCWGRERWYSSHKNEEG